MNLQADDAGVGDVVVLLFVVGDDQTVDGDRDVAAFAADDEVVPAVEFDRFLQLGLIAFRQEFPAAGLLKRLPQIRRPSPMTPLCRPVADDLVMVGDSLRANLNARVGSLAGQLCLQPQFKV